MLSSSDGIEFEKVAALQPDLIVGTNAGLTKADYDRLSKMAPTIAQSGDYSDYFEPWDVQHLAIGKALGQGEPKPPSRCDGIKADFAAAAEEHPEFAGTPAVFLQNAFYDGSAIAYQDGLSTDFLTDLGFVIPKEIDEYAADGQAYIPMENLDVLNNADVLVWGTEADTDRAELEKEPLYRNLDRGQERQPRLHRQHARRGDLLHQPAEPAVRARRARAEAGHCCRRRSEPGPAEAPDEVEIAAKAPARDERNAILDRWGISTRGGGASSASGSSVTSTGVRTADSCKQGSRQTGFAQLLSQADETLRSQRGISAAPAGQLTAWPAGRRPIGPRRLPRRLSSPTRRRSRRRAAAYGARP